MKISTKLFGAFAIVALICGIVGGVGWYGTSNTEASLIEIADVRMPSVRGAALMMGGMNEIKAIERTAAISSLTAEARRAELDKLKAVWQGFDKGFNMSAALPKNAAEEAIQKKFSPAVQKWKGEHEKMVQLISEVQLNDVEGLETILVARRLDHIKWVGGLDVAIAESTEFGGALDSTKCGLGKWLANFKSGSDEFDVLLDKFDVPHEKLHGLGAKVNEIIFMHNFTSMGESVEARDLFDSEVEPTLAEIEAIFEEVLEFVRRDIDRLNGALAIAFGAEQEAYDEAMGLLYQTSEMSADMAEEVGRAATAGARRSKIVTAISVLLGIILALSFGYFISRSITAPLYNIIEVIKRIGLGDTSDVNISTGKPVNCSSVKKCGNEKCPSYGKVDDCWVTSGSFATVKHCPRALKGEDCKTCEIYGAKNALEELGSIVTGMANGLAQRARLSLAIAAGDLTGDVELASDKDALGKALQNMQESLRTIIGQVQTAGAEIASGASQVADASQSLSQGATQSAASLEEVTASMNEMGSQTTRNAENATQANQLTTQAKDAAEDGNQQMKSMVEAMGEINESSRSISKIIKVIDEIAFQTNLLALNAAVEAARAGRHGKGFAVVAEEVRNLAARSAKAAKETADLIEGSVKKTENGTEIASSTAVALGEIVSGVTKVSDLVAEIAAASNEQAQGISQVNQGLAQIDQVTQMNTANAEESAAASEELSSQAGQLRQMLTRFKLKGQAVIAAEPAVAPAVADSAPQAQTAALENKSWGAAILKPEGGTEGAVANPAAAIALDDKEFGKF